MAVVQIVSFISDLVVQQLQTAGYPPLSAGKILVGRQYQAENTVPPRVLFIPMRSRFDAKSLSNPMPVSSNAPYSAEAHAQIQQRAIGTEWVTYEVRCWSATSNAEPVPDDIGDMEATWTLSRAVEISVHLLVPGMYKFETGEWVDAKEGSTQHVHLGREFVFGVTIGVPILDKLLPLVPPGTTGALGSLMVGPDGKTTGTGCT